MNFPQIGSSIVSKTKALRESAAHRQAVVERAAKVYHYGPVKTKVKKVTSGISGYVAPMLKTVKEESPSLAGLNKTISTISKNISKAKNAPENQGLSIIKKILMGLKNAKGDVAHSLGDVVGVNDVMLAKEVGGTEKAIVEGGKSALRVLASGALSFVCLPVPIPGAMIGGWFAGEKLVEKIVGKPLTKQLTKLK